MNGINGYQAYQNSYLQGAAYGKTESQKADSSLKQTGSDYETKDAAAAKTETVHLSEQAKKLLERLKKQYGNMDFMVANYDSDEEAQSYLSAGTKEYSVLIEPEVLEEMAADHSVEKKYTDMIDAATSKLSQIRREVGNDDTVARLGISFGKDGSVSYFAELEKSGEQQRERIEKAKAEKAEKAKKEEKAQEKQQADSARGTALSDKIKRVRVSADSAKGLLEAIRKVDWEQVKAQPRETVGGIINYGV